MATFGIHLTELLPKSTLPVKPRFLFYTLLVFGLVFGILQTFLNPPFQIPDEPAHWSAAVIRTERALLSKGPVCSPALGMADWFDTERIKARPREKIRPEAFSSLDRVPEVCSEYDINYGSTLSYPGASLGYLLFGKVKRPIARLMAFYMGRLLQGVIFVISLVLLLTSVVKASSPSKTLGLLFLFFLALTPKAIQQAFAVSSDGVVNAFSLSLASLVLTREVWAAELVWLAVVGLCAVSTKPVLVPLVLPAILWVMARSANSRWRRLLLGVGIFLTLAGVYYGLSAKAVSGVGDHPDQALKMHQLLAEPLKVIAMIVRSGLHYLRNYSWLSDGLGWLDFNSSHRAKVTFALVEIISFFLLGASIARPGLLGCWSAGILTGFSNYRGSKILVMSDVLFFLGILSSAALTSLILYLTWMAVGSQVVTGLQGRYFFPQLYLVVAWVFAKLDFNFIFDETFRGEVGGESRFAKAAYSIGYGLLILFFLENVCYRAMDLLSRYG